MKIKTQFQVIVFLFFLLLSGSVFGQVNSDGPEKKELIGQLQLSDILIQPSFTSAKPNFNLDSSYAFLSWKASDMLSAHFGIGKLELMNVNNRLHPTQDYKNKTVDMTTPHQYGFFEAYGQLDSVYGQVKAGLIPLMFGWEGGRRESEWIFPRTLFYGGDDPSYAQQNFALRDYGVQYNVSYENFYTYATLHNGNNDINADGRVWETGRIGWKTPSGVEIATSFSNGKYDEDKSLPTETFSYANLFGAFEFQNMFALIEGYYGRELVEVPSDGSQGPHRIAFWDVHFDLSHPITNNIAALLRYEEYNPNNNYSDALARHYIFGLEISNALKTSNLFIWWICNKQSANFMAAQNLDQVYNANDINPSVLGNELMVVWKIRSLSIF